MKLTQSQCEAVEHGTGHLQLIACAGSGKTEVVAQRVVRLLDPKHGGLRPANIIAFTFTDRAAAELRERIHTRCRERLGEVVGLSEMFIGTIHAFCLELIKAEAPEFMRFEVLNEVQQALFVDRNSRQSGLTTTLDLTGAPLQRYTDTDRYLSVLSILREADLVEDALEDSNVLESLAAYRKLLRQRSYLDYSSILEAAVQTLSEDAGLRQRLAERVRHVIVDEYQDVNPIQERLVRKLAGLGASICVVGDDDQTIYQWRGSDVRNIVTFAKRYKGARQVRLQENFRSSTGVVEAARAFIARNEGRLEKKMISVEAQPYTEGDIVALSFANPDEEAAHIARTLQSLRGVAFREGEQERGLSWSDMAILLRSVKASAAPITRALEEHGIPYVIAGMNNLFSRPEAEAARQLFYFMAGRICAEDLKAAWRAANLGLTPKALAQALEGAEAGRAALKNADEQRWSVYSLQRTFLSFLEAAELREETVPDGHGEVAFYNLGKFSQLISDFESIHFHSRPAEKYESFAKFLEYRAEDAYPEGWQNNQYANPDAVRIMTVHQAKGMQWPVVMVPALLRNRFPARKPGGRSVWHILPREGIVEQSRYEGSPEDERRLFYVAMTRAQKFLHLTWAPIPGNKQAQHKSEFWENVLESKWVKRRMPDYASRARLPPTPKASVSNVVFSFSDIKYFFECPYQFKLRILYGFNAPIHEALGYGKSLHDALAEVHGRAMRGDVASVQEVPRLVQTHLHTPYAYPALREKLTDAAKRVLTRYLEANAAEFDQIEFSEKAVQVDLGSGVVVNGRIDLVRRLDTGETTIVDLKSSERAQAEDVTETQLHVYALGYQELTGRRADYVEIYELDEGKRKPRSVDDEFIADVRKDVLAAAGDLRRGALAKKPDAKRCSSCDYQQMCSEGAKAGARGGKAARART